MKKYILIVCLTGFFLSLKAQVGINNETPKTSLDITKSSDTKSVADGILFPRVTVKDLEDKNNYYTVNQNGTIVYVTGGTSTMKVTSEITGPGYYYYKYNDITPADSQWFNLNLDGDHGNGSFTPKIVQIPASSNGTTFNWSLYENSDYNYFEFTEKRSLAGQINIPLPKYFKNKTIYFRNNTDKGVYLQATEFVATDPNDTNPLGSYTVIPQHTSLQLYSVYDEAKAAEAIIKNERYVGKWYIMTGQTNP